LSYYYRVDPAHALSLECTIEFDSGASEANPKESRDLYHDSA
jgi:hypothetical protein